MKIDIFNVLNLLYTRSENSNTNNTRDGSSSDTSIELIDNPQPNHCDQFQILHIKWFVRLMESNKLIQEFLEFDRCYKLADKYLLSMAFVYFIRAKIPLSEYNSDNFFAALHLAHDMEEEDDDLSYQVMVWFLGSKRKNRKDYFFELRDDIWAAMNYRAYVSPQCCLQVMNSSPDCFLWERERSPAHSGAQRSYYPQKQCNRCQIQEVQIYGTDLESNDSDEESEEDEPAIKRMKLNEE